MNSNNVIEMNVSVILKEKVYITLNNIKNFVNESDDVDIKYWFPKLDENGLMNHLESYQNHTLDYTGPEGEQTIDELVISLQPEDVKDIIIREIKDRVLMTMSDNPVINRHYLKREEMEVK